MGSLTVSRSAFLILLVVFSLIILSLNANFLNLATFHHRDGDGDDDDDDDSDDGDGDDYPHRTFGFETTGVAVAALTLLTVIPVLVMNFVRRRSAASIVLFEIGWVSILLVLWVVTAGQTSGTAILENRCSDTDGDLLSFCHQFQAIQAFSWLNFVILLLWLATVIVVAAMAHNRGHPRAWIYPFSDAAFLSRRPRSPPMSVETETVAPTPNPYAQSPGKGMLMHSSGSYQHPTVFPTTSPLGVGHHQITPSSQQGQYQLIITQHQERSNILPQV